MNGLWGDDILTLKLAASDGEILWAVHDHSSQPLDDRGWAIAVGPDGHPVVTGIQTTPEDPARYRTFKLDSADGTLIWGRTFPGAVNVLAQEAGWLGIRDDGDVIMANRTWESGAGYDVVLHRYDAADGDTVWTLRYDSSGGSDDPTGMVLDGAGDILVTGVRSGDFMALKFDAADGSLLWSTDWNGPAGGYDAAAALAEGPGGEVIVTGFATGSATSWDVATVAFDPTDGALLWERLFDAGEGRTDEGRALAVAPTGDVYVTGYCDLATSGSDLLALRYILADPTAAVPGPHAGASASSRLRVAAHPNPFPRDLSLTFDLARSAPTRLAIYDITGRRVALLHEGALSPGAHRIEWDGRDDAGRSIGPGVYLVRLESAGANVARKVVRSR